MTRRRSMFLILVLALTLAPGRASRADEGSFLVIVHPDSPVSSIDRDFLRRAYLKKVRDWDHGPTIRPIDLPRGAVRDRFTREVLKKSPSQLKNYWTQQIFSGKGVPLKLPEVTFSQRGGGGSAWPCSRALSRQAAG